MNVTINLYPRKRKTRPKSKYIYKDGEIFKDIKGYSLYKISNYGTVISSYDGSEIKQTINKGGYCKVGLYSNGIRKDFLIHKLVAEHFLDKPDFYDIVNHKDRNPSNNHYTNLEWCTQSYNVKYKDANKISTFIRSNKIACYNGSVLIGLYVGSNEAAKALNLSPTAVRKCLRDSVRIIRPYAGYKMTYSVKGYTFKYANDEQSKTIENEFFKSISK